MTREELHSMIDDLFDKAEALKDKAEDAIDNADDKIEEAKILAEISAQDFENAIRRPLPATVNMQNIIGTGVQTFLGVTFGSGNGVVGLESHAVSEQVDIAIDKVVALWDIMQYLHGNS